MPPPVPLPADVQTWLRNAFQSCNEEVSAVLTRVPTNHETALDMTFIDHFAALATPVQFPSGWLVEISTYLLGGGRHFGDWPELPPPAGDCLHLGFLALFRQRGRLIRVERSPCCNPSGRTPTNWTGTEDSPLDHIRGFGLALPRTTTIGER